MFALIETFFDIFLLVVGQCDWYFNDGQKQGK